MGSKGPAGPAADKLVLYFFGFFLFFFTFVFFFLGTELKSINDFLFQSQIDNINLFKVAHVSSVGCS